MLQNASQGLLAGNHRMLAHVQAKLVPNRALNTGLTALMRFSNTLVGSSQWIWIARGLGLQ